MPGPVAALLDVDHTLLFDGEMNIRLLDALKKKGIIDFYLFTDMTVDIMTIRNRIKLIEDLEDRDFTVHANITPNDITWQGIPAEEARKLNTWCLEEKLYKGIFAIEAFIESKKDEFPVLARTIKNYDPSYCTLGETYQEAKREYQNGEKLSDDIQIRSCFAQAFADHLAQKHHFKHSKGLLLDLFLRHKPDWVSSIVMADDNADVLDTIDSFKPLEVAPQLLPLTMIPVVGADNNPVQGYEDIPEAHYENALTAHFVVKDPDPDPDPDPILIKKSSIKETIDAHIKKLGYGWNPFKSSPNIKIKALQLLQKEILDADLSKKSIKDVIDHWNKKKCIIEGVKPIRTIAQEIAAHRNFFQSKFRPDVPTNTSLLIKSLKDKYGHITTQNDSVKDLSPRIF